MKKKTILTLLISILSFTNLIIANDIKHLIPKDTQLIDYCKGDLNKDGYDDIVVVYEEKDKSKIEIDSSLNDTLNTNNRILLICVFNKSKGDYEKFRVINNLIPQRISRNMADPFAGIQIKKGILSLGAYYWYSSGSWYMTNKEYKFRFQNNEFYLIGIESESTHRGTMESESISVNFSTRKMLVTNYSSPEYDENDEEIIEKKETWYSFKLNELHKITSIDIGNIQVLDKYL
ncbi:hypothetical protein KDU71_21365 [Carboxylicivirga sediminis]|uniref:VCBS repeat-containing protein n=1 Tax=Carboxylicivirga sediminis TaxID=2006564 RepID=A0A941F7Z4_9BACT|nr:hypothetical protein [Carboxylicivirga sediminis]MBR8538134.1 hypothetical protein [Carboxylicivirga sediminis]